MINTFWGLGAQQPVDRFAEFADSPVNGKMFVHGSIGGSAAAPEGEITVKLLDGALGPTRLAEATAHVELDEAQLLDFHLHMRPADAPGHLKVDPPATPTLPIKRGKKKIERRADIESENVT
jgi:hypothetical protein